MISQQVPTVSRDQDDVYWITKEPSSCPGTEVISILVTGSWEWWCGGLLVCCIQTDRLQNCGFYQFSLPTTTLLRQWTFAVNIQSNSQAK